MRDLEIWSGEPSPDSLAQLATWTLARRSPYFGKLRALVDRPEVALRAAVLRALAGATGVEGVRAIVRGLDDGEASVRMAALDALRLTARDAPNRYAHAVFHRTVEIRRASLEAMPPAASKLAIYLRADPACADLTENAAWPSAPLPLAFDLHGAGTLSARELLDVAFRVSPPELAAFFQKELRRSPEQVETYAVLVSEELVPAPGRDVIDQLVATVEHVLDHGDKADVDLAERVLEQRLVPNIARKPTPLGRRIWTSLCSQIARGTAPSRGRSALLETAIAFEPRCLASAGVLALGDRTVADAAIAGLFRYQWPVRLPRAQIERLLQLPLVREDLALATAIVGLGGSRLKRLAKLLGERTIVERLIASDRGWDELCRLPRETPALELAWLAKVEKANIARYIVLAGRALGVLRDTRLFSFVDQIPRRHRADAFLALVARTDVDVQRVAAAATALVHRLDRGAATSVLAVLLRDGNLSVARMIARELPDKWLVAAIADIDDALLVPFVAIIDGPDALPRELEISLANSLAARLHPDLQAWAARVLEIVPVTEVIVRAPVTAAIDETQRHRIATCSHAELVAALEPALLVPVTGLVGALGERAEGPS
nr:hypothetical protein [Deltaproteobacteria bacterium]